MHSAYSTLYQGVPHVSTADDVQDGFYLPQGTIVVPNIR